MKEASKSKSAIVQSIVTVFHGQVYNFNKKENEVFKHSYA